MSDVGDVRSPRFIGRVRFVGRGSRRPPRQAVCPRRVRAAPVLVDEIEGPEGDRLHMEALLWNFTVLGEASSQVSDALKQEARGIEWQHPIRLRNRSVHGYWSIDDQVLLSGRRGRTYPTCWNVSSISNVRFEADLWLTPRFARCLLTGHCDVCGDDPSPPPPVAPAGGRPPSTPAVTLRGARWSPVHGSSTQRHCYIRGGEPPAPPASDPSWSGPALSSCSSNRVTTLQLQ